MLLFPVAIGVFAAVEYLHGVPARDNDLLLAVVVALAGLALGTGCGLELAGRPGSCEPPVQRCGHPLGHARRPVRGPVRRRT